MAFYYADIMFSKSENILLFISEMGKGYFNVYFAFSVVNIFLKLLIMFSISMMLFFYYIK